MSKMTATEAAAKLAELLNEIEAADIVVATSSKSDGIWVGQEFIMEPPSEDEPWEIRDRG